MKVNVDDLREYMMNELLGVAFCCDFPASLIGVAEIESMSPLELCRKAEKMGVDLRKFEVR